MARREFEWIDYAVSLPPILVQQMPSLITEQAPPEGAEPAPPDRVRLALPDLRAHPTPRDKAKILLESAAEVEHALMVQYLYARYSLKSADEVNEPEQQAVLDETSEQSWPQLLLATAREEMGHLMTVQNLLILLGLSPNFEREDDPPRTDLYPFPLMLQPLTRSSLAKYVVAEAPSDATGIDDIVELATGRAGSTINHVGVLYGLLGLVFTKQDQVEAGATGDPHWDAIVRMIKEAAYQQQPAAAWHLPDSEFRPETVGHQADPDDWNVAALRVHRVADRGSALNAIRDIAEQGEGPTGGGETSHFERFLHVFRGGDGQVGFPPPGSWVPTRAVPTNPKIADFTHQRTRGWAELADARYSLLLGFLGHYLGTSTDVRRILTGWIFAEMRSRLGFIARQLTSVPLGIDPAAEARAAVPFTLHPEELKLPDGESARWRVHRDRTAQAIAIAQRLRDVDTPDPFDGFLARLLASDQARLETMKGLAGPTTTSFVRDIEPLFRQKDIEHMDFLLDLADHDKVKAKVGRIVARTETADPADQMPPAPDPHWTRTQIELLRQWVDDDFPP
jgi:hypothetical protein